jgi:hypothetical protein
MFLDARWNPERQAVEFGVEIGEYRGVVRGPRRVFQRLLPDRPTRAVVGGRSRAPQPRGTMASKRACATIRI